MTHPGLDRKCFFCLFHDGVKSSGVVDRHLGKHLAVQFNAGLVKPGYELAVPQSALASGGIDTGNPQSTEIPLSQPPITVGEDVGADDRFLGRSEQVVSPADITLGPLEEATFCPGACCTFLGSHSSLPFLATSRPFPTGEALPARAVFIFYFATQLLLPLSAR